jgi:hypothetical protein
MAVDNATVDPGGGVSEGGGPSGISSITLDFNIQITARGVNNVGKRCSSG